MEVIFHQLSTPEVLKHLDVTESGLTTHEVNIRQQQYGKNTIPQPKGKSILNIFLHQFFNPLIYVLIGAAVISGFSGALEDTVFVMAIITINAILGTYQEWRAENSALALRNMVKVLSRVKRDGRIHEIDSEELVPGDIVLLESGQKVPADLRLIEVNDLSVEEALLTGESVAVMKQVNQIQGGNELALGDRHNMAFAATTVQKGRALGIVVGTARDTQIGLIADSLSSTTAEKPPLINRMESFSKKISVVVVLICVVLGVIGYFEGMAIRNLFFLMVAVGVSAIPEGLPVALTVALSIGTRRMAERNVIVRKLPAVEGLGSCTLIASDKTGTLTIDQQSIKRLFIRDKVSYEVTGQGYNGDGEIIGDGNPVEKMNAPLHEFILAAVISNEGVLRRAADKGWQHSGDPVDVAFRSLAYKVGKEPKFFKDQVEVVKMIPYESERKFSGVFYKQNGKLHFAMKGAVETVGEKLSEADRNFAVDQSEQMAAQGFRVLALAAREVLDTDVTRLPPLDFLGLAGMIDPLREEAKAAVAECHQAGIRVVMVTGDHPSTAFAIARELGLAQQKDEVISGMELVALDKMSPAELAGKIENKTVFARVAPLQKQRIVQAMKSLGHFVAVTGDGANDAPALKSAHIGVAMGAGTDLAKEASSIIVTDNNFASITAGVEEGRYTFDNLRKIIFMLISTGAAELLTVGLAIITNIPMPFLAVQLLWLNLVTNGIQDIGLAFEKGDPEVMRKPPRKPDENIFDRLMNWQILVSGATIAAVVFVMWYYLLNVLHYEERHARTITVMLMVLLQNFHALSCRSETKSIFTIPFTNNVTLIVGIVIAQLVHISASYIPGLNTTLQLDPITLDEWIRLVPTAMSVVVVVEIFKWIWRSKYESLEVRSSKRKAVS